MTAAQKTAKVKFKQAIAYRQKTGVTLKEAFAHIYGKKVGVVKKKAASKKKATKKVIRKVVKKAVPKKKAAKKKIGYSKIRLKQEKGITKVLKNTPRTLFPYTAEEKIVKAGKKYFDQEAKKINGLHKIEGNLSISLIKRLDSINKEIEQRQDVIANVIQNKKYFDNKNGKSWYPKFMKLAKSHIAELKKHKTEIKKLV